MKHPMVVLLVSMSFCGVVSADTTAQIKQVNTITAQIEKNKGGLEVLDIKVRVDTSEGVPPEMMYYYKAGSMELVMLQVTVGHEVFSTRHVYYFRNKKIIKYLKESSGHPASPPRQAIIYDSDGKPLWQNLDAPAIDPGEVKQLFERSMDLLKGFAAY